MAQVCQLFEQAVQHHQRGDLDQAVRLYQETLRSCPDHVHAQFNLAMVQRKRSRLADAADGFRNVLRLEPANARAHFQLANVLRAQGLLSEAAAAYRQALACNPELADACNNLGVLLKQEGQPAQAIACYQQALRIQPEHADALNNLGVALLEEGKPAEAGACFRRALAANSGLIDAEINLGNALLREGQAAQAVECYRHALTAGPDHAGLADAHNNLGSALEILGDAELAVTSYRKVLELRPDSVDGHHNLSFALSRLGQLTEAWTHNREALRLNPAFAPALFQRALLNLLAGRYQEAWPDYEHRWLLPNGLQGPRWDGTPLAGKTIFVCAEQGLGDTIQFARFLPLVAQRAGKVLLGCQPALVSLCRGVEGVSDVITHGQPLPPHDVHVPLLSLPGIFGTTLASIPQGIPYLRADPVLVQRWQEKLAACAGVKVGVVWHGSAVNKGNAYRCVPLQQLEPLGRVPGVCLISLQVGEGREQLTSAPFSILDIGKLFDPASLADLAAALMNVDVVVTIETGVAHLAGALGVPVWNLVCRTPDWRWLLDRSDSPWYPTMQLFRQSRLGQWQDVVERVAEELRVLAHAAMAS